MSIMGPRLDRPSAIGDEGRPRATSLTIASLAVFGLLLVTGYVVDIVQIMFAVATLTALVTLGLALLNRERFLAVFIGQLCYVLGGTGIVALLASLLVFALPYGMLLTGFSLAMLGLSATWADVGNRSSTKTALFQGGLSSLMMYLWFVVVIGVGLASFLAWTFLPGRAADVPPTPSILLFAFAVCLSALLVWAGTRWLPFRQLAPRHRRPRLESRLTKFRLALAVVAGTAVLTVAITVVTALLGGLDLLYATAPSVAALLSGLSAPSLLGGVLLAGLLAFVAGVLALMIRRATRPVDARANRLLAGVVAGFTLTIVMIPFLLPYIPLPGYLRLLVLILILVVGPASLLLLGVALLVGVELGVLPDRAGGPALAASGMVVATIGTGLVGAPAPLVFTCAAAAMLVWDVSSFGLGVTAELGHIPETRRLELFHGLLSAGLGVLVVGVLTGLDLARTTVASGVVVVPAVVLAVVAVLALLVPVRG